MSLIVAKKAVYFVYSVVQKATFWAAFDATKQEVTQPIYGLIFCALQSSLNEARYNGLSWSGSESS